MKPMLKYFSGCFLFFCFLVFFTLGCEKNPEYIDVKNIGQQYFPIHVGKFWIYESDSIILRGGGTERDTVHSFIKEEVSSFFVNGKDTIYDVEIFFKRNLNDTFRYQKTVFVSKTNNMVTRQEDNLLFTKLVFPMKQGLRFDHNQFFDKNIDIMIGGETFLDMYTEWSTRVESYDEPYNWSGKTVNKSRIRLVEDETPLDEKVYYEEYLENVGLYKKEMLFLQDSKGGTQPVSTRAIRGFYHQMTLLETN